MRISLITEGTYPFAHGGVSVWCDHLMRRLPDIDFHLYAIAATTEAESVWKLPPNVVSFETIGLEPIGSRPLDRYPRRDRSAFLDVFDHFIHETLRPDPLDETAFLGALQTLYEAAQRVPIASGVHSQEAFEIIRSHWHDRQGDDQFDRLGPPTLLDVLEVSSSLARFLMPLQVTPTGDLAHTTANGLGSLLALAGAWEWDMPTLLTEHGVYLRERYLETPATPLPRRVAAFQLAFFKRLNRAMLEAADGVAPVSDFNRRWEIQTGADDRRISTIYNGVDPASFPPLIGEPDVPTISWIGRVDPLKDLLTLIDAFARVRRAVPEARLRLFGPVPPGNEAYHQQCLDHIAAHGLAEAVTFEGHTNRVSDAHRAGHVVALSSISEGFPFTVLEAMMSGRATVSTDVGGVVEAVGSTGLLVPPRDPGAFAAALVELLTDDELRQRLGRAARERALAEFTLDRMTDRYRSLYESLIDHGTVVPFPAPAADPAIESPIGTGHAVGGRS